VTEPHPSPLPPLPEGCRRVRDDDAAQLIAVISAAYDEHPGCVLDLPGVDDDLPAPGTTAGRRGSPWWVVERDGQLVASIAAGPLEPDGNVELKRLYLAAAARGRGLATELIAVVEAHAAGLGASSVVLWSDTRFQDAHRRYEALGYVPTGETRPLHDPSNTTEYRFVKPVRPAPPDVTVVWIGPAGREDATLTALPDGWLLATDLPDRGATARVEVDGSWRTSRAEVEVEGSPRRVLTADGRGTWWLDGAAAAHLAGAVDVDVEVTPLTNTLPIRRLLVEGRDEADVRAAWVRVPGEGVEPLEQRYTHLGGDRWRYRASSGFEAELTVDDHGLVERYGDLWRRT
jgi:GNAT superfamily N-acetyltransferase